MHFALSLEAPNSTPGVGGLQSVVTFLQGSGFETRVGLSTADPSDLSPGLETEEGFSGELGD